MKTKKGMELAHISIAGDYKPGDPPPAGYCNWHEWAQIQHRAGLRQKQCDNCGRWRYPQEIAESHMEKQVTYRTKKDSMLEENPIERMVEVSTCNECHAKRR